MRKYLFFLTLIICQTTLVFSQGKEIHLTFEDYQFLHFSQMTFKSDFYQEQAEVQNWIWKKSENLHELDLVKFSFPSYETQEKAAMVGVKTSMLWGRGWKVFNHSFSGKLFSDIEDLQEIYPSPSARFGLRNTTTQIKSNCVILQFVYKNFFISFFLEGKKTKNPIFLNEIDNLAVQLKLKIDVLFALKKIESLSLSSSQLVLTEFFRNHFKNSNWGEALGSLRNFLTHPSFKGLFKKNPWLDGEINTIMTKTMELKQFRDKKL